MTFPRSGTSILCLDLEIDSHGVFSHNIGILCGGWLHFYEVANLRLAQIHKLFRLDESWVTTSEMRRAIEGIRRSHPVITWLCGSALTLSSVSLSIPFLCTSFPRPRALSCFSLSHPLFHSVLALPPPPISILFPLLRKIQASSLGPSLLFGFFGSVDCSMVILYFMANIHL